MTRADCLEVETGVNGEKPPSMAGHRRFEAEIGVNLFQDSTFLIKCMFASPDQATVFTHRPSGRQPVTNALHVYN
jgi:hypothetical protein